MLTYAGIRDACLKDSQFGLPLTPLLVLLNCKPTFVPLVIPVVGPCFAKGFPFAGTVVCFNSASFDFHLSEWSAFLYFKVPCARFHFALSGTGLFYLLFVPSGSCIRSCGSNSDKMPSSNLILCVLWEVAFKHA